MFEDDTDLELMTDIMKDYIKIGRDDLVEKQINGLVRLMIGDIYIITIKRKK